MTDAIITRIDDMGERIDELEKRYAFEPRHAEHSCSVNDILVSGGGDESSARLK